jgi:hypothetical protein
LSVLKEQKRYYSGKQKRHTLKTQLLVSLLTGEVIVLAFSNGKKRDFQLFKDSGIHVKEETELEADTGYQGLAQIHANSLLPKKRSKSLFNISPHPSWRHIFRPDCVKNPCNPSGFCGFLPCRTKKPISPIRTR